MTKTLPTIILTTATALLGGCRGDIYVEPSTPTDVDQGRITAVDGFYLLNEGNMGSNRASLDWMDEITGRYIRNIYAERNPSSVKELGDVGNDLKIYGSKMYATINCSHKLEVMDASDARRVTHIDIPNCRYIAAAGGYVYVSSYVSPVQMDPHAPLGAVYKVDTLTMKVVDRVDVGYQPEEMAVASGKLYVANSGGYRKPAYDRRVTVIGLSCFKVLGSIDVDINLHRLRATGDGRILVSSRGNNSDIPSRLHVIDTATDHVTATVEVPVTNLALRGDSAYIISSGTNEYNGNTTVSYSILDLNTLQVVDNSIIKDGTEAAIRLPYAIALHPVTGEILITDARNYVSSGRVHCYSPDGHLRWSATTGDIPAVITFRKAGK